MSISPLYYYYPRRFLTVDKVHADAGPAPTPTTFSPQTTFDANVIMILALLLCALICALGLNSIVRCALRCASRVTLDDRCFAGGGVNRKALKSLPTMTYSDGLQLPGSGSECAICLAEFGPGERLRVLPRCNHRFHVACVDRWLMAHSSCPTCRQCLTNVVAQKTCRCAVQREVYLNPLDPEDPFYDYRGHY